MAAGVERAMPEAVRARVSAARGGGAAAGGGPAWWPIAFSDELGSKPLAVCVGRHEIVLFRDLEGAPCAVDDRCPHRRAPLSYGWVTEKGALQCGYHGWCFDGKTGICVEIPNYRPDERVPPSFRVATYPCAEQVGFLFVWLGGASNAGALDLPSFGSGDRVVSRGRRALDVSHELVVAGLLHDPLEALGLLGSHTRALEAKRTSEPDSIVIERLFPETPPTLRGLLGLPDRGVLIRSRTFAVSGTTELTAFGTASASLGRILVAPLPHGERTELRWLVTSSSGRSWPILIGVSALDRLGRGPIQPRRPEGVRTAGDAVAAWRALAGGLVSHSDEERA